jgi:hypothetical protein
LQRWVSNVGLRLTQYKTCLKKAKFYITKMFPEASICK